MRICLSKWSKYLTYFLVIAFVLGYTGTVVSAPRGSTGKPAGQRGAQALFAPDQVLVKFKTGVSKGQRETISRAAGIEKTLGKIGPKHAADIFLFKLKSKQSPANAVNQLKKSGDVLLAEPNYVYNSLYTPNDAAWSEQWGLHNTGQAIQGVPGLTDADVDAPEGWEFETGFSNPTVVAVIDSGIDLGHPDLAGKLWQNTDEIAGNGLDDDSNGFVDDTTGYNFAGITQPTYSRVLPLSSFDYEFAQSIKGTGQPLTHVSLGLAGIGTPVDDIDIAVRDELDGSDLATASISAADTSVSLSWVETSLSVPVNLATDNTYYIVIKTVETSPNVENQYLVADMKYEGSDDFYRDGMEHWKVGSDWLAFSDYDLAFRTNRDASPRDDNGHGTHVSGIVGAATNNAVGIAGTAPGAKIMPIKVMTSSGDGYLADIMEGIYYAADNGAQVINMSLGGPSSDLLQEYALDYADSKGITIVAAAGNEGPGEISFPAASNNVIAVGATDNQDNIAGFSNTNAFVDFAAPGVDIYSTLPTYPVALNSKGYNQNYDYLSGTSMASPMVAGLAALLLAKNPALKPVQVEKILEKGAEDLGAIGRDDQFGHGRVNIYKSFAGLILNTSVTVSPTAPDGDNDWYINSPTVVLQPNLSNARSFYAWDSTASVTTTYTVPLRPAQGQHTLYYYSKTASATETVQGREFKLDSDNPTDPTSLTSSSHIAGALSNDNTVEIAFSGAADAISGIGGYSISWSQTASETPSKAVNLAAGAGNVTSSPLADGVWWFNLRTKDTAGNWTSTLHLGPFMIDATAPGGTITVNAAAANTNNGAVVLGLTADDGAGSGLDKMRFSNDGTNWSAWQSFAATSPWSITAGDGPKRVYAQFKDVAGGVSAAVHDDITLDTVAPLSVITAPVLSTDISKTRKFVVGWTSVDPALSSGLVGADVQYKVGAVGAWTDYLTGTLAEKTIFTGTGGRTYYYRARARDNAGNVGAWSAVVKTIVPYDQGKLVVKRSGFSSVFFKASSGFYLGTIRYSTHAGDKITYKVTGKSFSLIVTKGPNRSKVAISVDHKAAHTIDGVASTLKFRRNVFSTSWPSVGTHTIEITNLGTSGRPLFDIDAIAVGR